MYIQLCSNNRRLHSHNICIIYTHTRKYLTNIFAHLQRCINCSMFVLLCKIYLFCIHVVVKFLLSAFFKFFVLLIVEQHSKRYCKTTKKRNGFSNWVVDSWNNLLSARVNVSSLNSFNQGSIKYGIFINTQQ